MKEELISFETAKLAKEKGFELASKSWYNFSGLLVASNSICKPCNNSKFPSYSCVTQSLLQKWLREEKDMYVIITYDGVLFDVSIYGRYTDNEIIIKSYLTKEPTFYTYEQALEAGLLEALKQIKL